MWEKVDCDQRNGRIIEYIVIISNNSNTYNLTSTERYITVNDLVLGGIYSISVAAVNFIGIGPSSDNIVLQIVTSTGVINTSAIYVASSIAVTAIVIVVVVVVILIVIVLARLLYITYYITSH